MIAVLRGRLYETAGNQVIIDVHGVGYQMLVTGACLASLGPVGDDVSVHTYLQLKEDAAALYGFATLEEKELFQRIIAVSGAGPKTALGILTAMNPPEFIGAVQRKDTKALTKISGVGRKTAERLILELQDTVDALAGEDWTDAEPPPVPKGGILEDARDALQALGYSQAESDAMLGNIGSDIDQFYDLQALLKAALTKHAAKRGR